jgi:hypothetical protein
MNSLWLKLFLIPVYLFITAVPLAGNIGANLEYEYALLVGWLALLTLPLFAVFLPSQFLPKSDGRFYVAPAVEILWIFLLGPAIALLSPAWMFFTGLCPCSRMGFGFWSVTLTLPAWVLAHAVMWLVLRARVQGLSRWKLLGGFLALVCALVLLDGARLWFSPQKRLLSFFSGFLHGPIYDDWIIVDHGIMLARLSHLLLALALLLLVWIQKSARQRHLWAAVVIVLGAWIGAGLAAVSYPSTSMGKTALDRMFQRHIDGEGFTLHYVKAGNGGGHPMTYRRLARDTQFHLNELKTTLGLAHHPHIHVYVYPDERRKKLWFGGGSTDVADVRTPSIHIDDNSWPHPTLRHELVHAITSGIGFHGLGFHPNMAFTEGLAVALAPDGRTLSLNDGAASVIESGRVGSVEGLFSPMFWQAAGSRAYTVAGSFIRYLIQESGVDKVKGLYGGKGFSAVFGKDQQRIISEWKQHVTAGFDREKNAVFSEALFRYPGVFADLCPHGKEDLKKRRDADIYIRLRQPLGWDPDEDYLQWRTVLDPDDRGSRLKIWRQSIQKVAMDRLPSPGRLETWKTVLRKYRRFPPETLEDVEAGILESDVARIIGDREDSRKILQDLMQADQKTFFGFSYQREIAARIAVEDSLAEEQALEWRRFLAGWRRAMPEESLFAGPWITTYLKLRNMKADRISPAELDQASALEDIGAGLPETFVHEWHKILAGKFMYAGQYDRAAAAYKAAAKSAQGSMQELMEEHARRAAYYHQTGRLSDQG